MNTLIDEYDVDVIPMMLSELLQGVAVSKMFQTLYGQMVVTHDVQVNHVQYDSRRVERGDLFVAIRGLGFDGHKFVSQAVANGAKVVIIEDDAALPDSFFMHAGVVKVVVQNSRVALARISANHFRHPSRQLMMIGVTGTNGKTTTTHLIKSILEASGYQSGLIGTIEYKIGNKILSATHTTPESFELNELLAQMVAERCSATVMEVSSHALHQHRVDGIHFQAAVFTNLTQDHLDYHQTMENYFNAKKMLFDSLTLSAYAVINIDDDWGERLFQATSSSKVSYSTTGAADVCSHNVMLTMNGTSFTAIHQGEETQLTSRLIGRFNVSNILAAFAFGVSMGIEKSILQKAIGITEPVRGRFEQITSPSGWTAIIDYAHTPDALLKAIFAVKDIFASTAQGKLITVFGCGGNRDRSKRPIMGDIATKHSDTTIITSDNPRSEDPDTIIDEIMTGVKPHAKVMRTPDRREAIITALKLASKNDVVLIAGKGHEDYQVIGNNKFHFSDKEAVKDYLHAHA